MREQKAANHGLRLFQQFKTVVRLRRIHRQPGASLYKESLIRTRDGAMTKGDHELWKEHDLTDPDTCKLTGAEKTQFNRLPHLFAENAPAGARNGFEIGQLAARSGVSILRVSSCDSSGAASLQPHENFGQLRRVVHLAREAPMMLLANLRTSVGLVNGAMGTLKAVVVEKDLSKFPGDLRKSVPANAVRYLSLIHI